MSTRTCLCLVLLAAALPGCTTTRPYVAAPHRAWQQQAPPGAEPAYRVFLLGDAGAATSASPVLRLLRTHLAEAGARSAVIFLGDNVYGSGLPDSAAAYRAQAEARLRAQLDAVKDHPGRVVFLPGNHDWDRGEPGGLDAVIRQERFVEAYLDRGNTFLPDDGFPGPVEVELTDHLTLIALDTQWWLHPFDKSYGDTGDYDLDEDGDFLLQLDDVIQRNRKNDLLVVGHHPLRSNGKHSGYLPWRDHVFPLTKRVRFAYLPLPGLGSLYPLYMRAIGGRQDLAHRRYRTLRRGLDEVFARHDGLIYAAGHDHSLQYFRAGGQHYVISGAGSLPEPVARGQGAAFAAGRAGFVTLDYYRDGAVWLVAWTPEDDGAGRLLFRTQLAGPAADRVDAGVPAGDGAAYPDYADSTAVVVPNPDLAAGGVKRFLWGSLRRDAWTTPVEVPYLDLGREAGGLTPVKRGGGLQSTSLRLAGADGKEYVLRSVRKDPSKALPEGLRRTVAGAISRDQAAMQHPFAAFIVPPLAEAVGVYHANPKPVYVPQDPRLGVYQDVLGGQLMLFEERPNDDMSHAPHFGGSRDVVGAPTMYRKVTDDNDHRVDQRALARARLFDLLLSDWDRHVDQWRWASFEPYELDPSLEGEARKEGKIYRPIPRDRDVALNRFNGLFPGLAQPFTKYQDFQPGYGNLKGLTFNAWEQDHRFLSALDRAAWIDLAEDMRAALTDTVIEDAVRRWPAPFFDQDGEETIAVLKARRDQLPAVAEAFYRLHARSVDVVGSNKHERFEVRRLNDEATEVVMYKISKRGEILAERYRRTFYRGETQEVVLYGLDGDDVFDVSGEVNRGLVIAAVGGPGADRFTDTSRVRGLGKKTRFYDTAAGNAWAPGRETRVVRSDDPAIHRYENKTPSYHIFWGTVSPEVVLASDEDNGLSVGGGVRITRHGLRKRPYARAHSLTASYALGAGAVTLAYRGHYVADFGGWDALLDARWLGPNTIRNFFGLGNETEAPKDREETFNQTRLSQLTLAPALLKASDVGVALRLGPRFEITDVRIDEDRFIGQPEAGVPARTFGNQWYFGGEAALTFTATDRLVNPRQGVRWTNTGTLNVGARDAEGTFTTLRSELVFYASPSLSPQVTLAARVGGAHTVGDFPYYHANTLGGLENLRGYRNDRFAGRSSLFQNVELRVGLLDFATYLALGEAGLLGFFDNGRVWTDGERSRAWHQGYGGGAWLNFFGQFVLTGTYGVSEEEEAFTLKVGFLY